jgi:hypothetical protein
MFTTSLVPSKTVQVVFRSVYSSRIKVRGLPLPCVLFRINSRIKRTMVYTWSILLRERTGNGDMCPHSTMCVFMRAKRPTTAYVWHAWVLLEIGDFCAVVRYLFRLATARGLNRYLFRLVTARGFNSLLTFS